MRVLFSQQLVAATIAIALALLPSTVAAAPANDNRANAAPVGVGQVLPFSSVGATQEAGEANHAQTGTNSVWFSLRSDVGVSVSIDTLRSSFDTVLAVYRDGPSGLVEVVTNDDVDDTPQSRVVFRVDASVDYLVAVSGFAGETGDGQLAVTEVEANQAGLSPVEAALWWSAQLPAGSIGEVLIGRDDVFADNLSSGALQRVAPLLLTPGHALDPRVREEINRLGATTATILGGTAAVSAQVEAELRGTVETVRRLAGGSRWDTAIEVARVSGATTAVLARAFDSEGGSGTAAWADSVAAGAWAAEAGLTLLLTPTGQLVPSVADFLREGQIQRVIIVGGEAAISAAVAAEVTALVPDTTRVSGADRAATALAIARARTGLDAAPAAGAILVPGFDPFGWAGGLAAALLSARSGQPVVLANAGGVSVETGTWMAARPIAALICGPPLDPGTCDAATGFVTLLPPQALDWIGPLPEGGFDPGRILQPGPYHGRDHWAAPDLAHVVADGDGVEVLLVDELAGRATAHRYDSGLRPAAGTIDLSFTDWPLWGGFHADPGGDRYVLVGRPNHGEDPAAQTVAVRRYDDQWALRGTATFTNDADGVYEPFDATAADMVRVGDRLVVHAARTMFVTPDGIRHQSNMTFDVDLDTMATGTFERPYSSHSFNQFATTDASGSDLVLIDHGDAYPRAIQIGVYEDFAAARPSGDPPLATRLLMEFNSGEYHTGAAVTGLVAGPSGVLVSGNSIAQPGAPDGPQGPVDEHRNAFVIASDLSSPGTITWLTSFPPAGGPEAREPRIAQIGDDRFVLLFTVMHPDGRTDLEYRLLNSAGTVLAERTWEGSYLGAVSEPVLVGDSLLWVAADEVALKAQAYLFGIDVADPLAPSLLGR